MGRTQQHHQVVAKGEVMKIERMHTGLEDRLVVEEEEVWLLGYLAHQLAKPSLSSETYGVSGDQLVEQWKARYRKETETDG